jgi:hypothetical protein
MLGVALGSTPATNGILIRGYIRSTSYTFTKGAPLYVSRTPGAFTDDISAYTTGDYVRLVGYQVATNTIYFNPDNTWVEVA